MKDIKGFKFWGSATVGTKGQIVIPAEAREALDINEGDKIIILSAPGGDGFMAIKPELFEQYVKEITKELTGILKK